MTAIQLAAWSSVLLALPAAISVARRTAAGEPRARRVLDAAVACAALLVVPLQVEAALELAGVLDRMTLLGPALAAGLVLLTTLPPRSADGRAGGGSKDGGHGSARRLPTSVIAAVTGIALVYAVVALERLTGFPTSWDGVWYHLPVAAGWLREGSLALGPDPHFYEAIPGNGDLLALLAMGTGWEALAEVWNLLPAVAVVAACHLLARRAGAGRVGAILAAVTVAAVPIVLFQSFSAYVDLFVAGWLIASLALVAGLFARGTGDVPEGADGATAALTMAGLACGLAVGAKATAWPTALLVVAAAVAWAVLRAGGGPSRKALLVAAFGAAVAAPGLFWFVRNFAATGNPAFPLEISLFGQQIFGGTGAREITLHPYESGLVEEVTSRIAYPWVEEKGAGYPYGTGGGLGPLFATFVVPGVAYFLWGLRPAGGSSSAPRGVRGLRIALAVLLAALVAVWWLVLGPIWRFGLPAVILACALAAPFLGAFRRSLPRAFGILLLAAVATFGAISLLPSAQALAHRVRHGEWSRAEYYHLPAEVRAIPPNATVVNVDVAKEGWNNYALLGPDLRRRVVPDWEVRSALEGGLEEEVWICGAYVVDRAPFQLEPSSERVREAGLALLAETDAQHGDVRWRIWRVAGRGCPDGARPG